MNNILRSKQGNLSKIKYFLPNYRQQPSETVTHNPVRTRNSNSKKNSTPNVHTRSLQ
jgi:hypothetical protein